MSYNRCVQYMLLVLCICSTVLSDTMEDIPNSNIFDQKIEAQVVMENETIKWDTRELSISDFLDTYKTVLNKAKYVEFTGLTNRMGEIMMEKLTDHMNNNECSITSLVFNGLRDEECPSMQREERKRQCKMSRDSILRQLISLFSKCPLEQLSIEGNHFSLSGIIELAQNVSSGIFPSLRLLNVDDNNYNYDSVAIQKLMRIIETMPLIDVRSFYVETINVIKHNNNEDTPFRYNFDSRYPSKCEFYSEPIKNEEFELLIKYKPCIYAENLLAHGTSRGKPWVDYMTTMFKENVFINMKNMEIYGNDIYKGDVDTFLSTFTSEHFPVLQTLDLSSNSLTSIHITADMTSSLEKLYLDTNGLTTFIIDDGALPNLNALKLGYNQLKEFRIGKGAAINLQKLYIDNNELDAEIVKFIVNAPFAKSLTHLSLFNNPSIEKDAKTFFEIFTNAIKEHRFENLKMLYLGQCGLKAYCKQLEQISKENIPTLKHVTCF